MHKPDLAGNKRIDSQWRALCRNYARLESRLRSRGPTRYAGRGHSLADIFLRRSPYGKALIKDKRVRVYIHDNEKCLGRKPARARARFYAFNVTCNVNVFSRVVQRLSNVEHRFSRVARWNGNFNINFYKSTSWRKRSICRDTSHRLWKNWIRWYHTNAVYILAFSSFRTV